VTEVEVMDWITRAQALNSELAKIEEAAANGSIPSEAITKMRHGVDHCRTALWAAVVGSSQSECESKAAILASRLARVQEMCNRIVEEVAAGRIWLGTPGLGRFVATLEATEKYVRSLLEESDSAQSE